MEHCDEHDAYIGHECLQLQRYQKEKTDEQELLNMCVCNYKIYYSTW